MATPSPRGESRPCAFPLGTARQVERAAQQQIVGGEFLGIGLALGVGRPSGQTERVVVGERWLFALRPDEVDAGDGDMRTARPVEALGQCIDHLGADRSPEAHHPRSGHCIGVVDRPYRLAIVDHSAGRVGERQHHRLRTLVVGVVVHRDRDGLADLAGGKGQPSARRRVVQSGRRGAVAGGVVDRRRPVSRTAQGGHEIERRAFCLIDFGIRDRQHRRACDAGF